jgi:hypothetical protein
MNPKRSLPSSQEPTVGHCLLPEQSIPHIPSTILQHHCQQNLPVYFEVPEVANFSQIFLFYIRVLYMPDLFFLDLITQIVCEKQGFSWNHTFFAEIYFIVMN